MASLYSQSADGVHSSPLPRYLHCQEPQSDSHSLPTTESPLPLTWSFHAIERIRAFLSIARRTNYIKDPLKFANLTEEGYNFVEELLKNTQLKHQYNTKTQVLMIKARLSHIHEGCTRLLNVLERAVERAAREGGFACNVYKASSGTLELFNDKGELIVTGKEGDGCLMLDMDDEDLDPPRLPYLILEVGYSESYVDLVNDAREWLLERDKEVLAVILMKVGYKKPARLSHRPEDWEAFVEVWERDRTGRNICQSGDRVTFLPPQDPTPLLRFQLNHAIPRHLLPDGLKEDVLSISLEPVVRECCRRLAIMGTSARRASAEGVSAPSN